MPYTLLLTKKNKLIYILFFLINMFTKLLKKSLVLLSTNLSIKLSLESESLLY